MSPRTNETFNKASQNEADNHTEFEAEARDSNTHTWEGTIERKGGSREGEGNVMLRLGGNFNQLATISLPFLAWVLDRVLWGFGGAGFEGQ